eukprot:CAMPEP_0170487398 /NCGR_PEP_ID=MMETSP0208-20121228/6218_2 /TAXON_ID=197538 /ORGANISM="Strombidium inclinatum, Strain S3" /LENGTH=253 /DNA_ID=CAMNT_0010761661 /DNA_START=337 /DNA_END=1098 /DNA_ORIENTATION=-
MGVNAYQSVNYLLGISRHHFRVFEVGPHDFGVEFLFILTPERECASEESIEKNSKSPHVYLAAVVLVLSHELWGHVRWSSTENFVLLTIAAEGGESEINNFYHVRCVLDQDIIELDIPVSDALVMQVVEGLSDLLEEATAGGFFYLAVGALLLDELVEADTTNIISYYANLLAGFDQVVHLDDVGMVNLPESQDLPLHRLPLHTIVELRFLINLDGILLHCLFVLALVNYRISTLANGLSNSIVLQLAGGVHV